MTDDYDDAPLLTLSDARHGPALVLSVTGDIDVLTGPQLRAALAEALGAADVDPVVVDLTGVTFMGSTGIAVLVDANWEAGQRSKSLRLVIGGAKAVLRPFEAAGVLALFDDYAEVGRAVGP